MYLNGMSISMIVLSLTDKLGTFTLATAAPKA